MMMILVFVFLAGMYFAALAMFLAVWFEDV